MNSSPDAITLDVIMPGLDGWSVLTSLKSDPDLAEIPVILLTITDNKNMGYALGASEYLTKPIETRSAPGDPPEVPEAWPAQESRIMSAAMPKILLVEDNEMNRDMLARRLQYKGYQVVIAVDGQAGVEMGQARGARPDPDGHEPAGPERLGSDAAR